MEWTNRTKSLDRFLEAQKDTYDTALAEIRDGKKTTHWIWYVFPQLKGLGLSFNSNFYGIEDISEARRYLDDTTLSSRLKEISSALLSHKDMSAADILGDIDALKVRSSMTLFDLAEPNSIFAEVLQLFYGGERDQKTIDILRHDSHYGHCS